MRPTSPEPGPETAEADTRIDCPDCQKPLDVHQPDPEQPERLLGTCPACKAWFLLGCGEGGLFRLPNPAG